MRTVLIDGDIIVHKAAAAAQTAVDWGDGYVTSHADVKRGKQLVDLAVAQVRERTQAGEIRVALSDPEHRWRPLVLPTYKANRAGPKPLILPTLVSYITEVYGGEVVPWLEGDDLLGLWATEDGREDAVVWSPDKDIASVPCTLYQGKGSDPLEVDLALADLNHLVLSLAGDTTDGYSGCPKVGAVTARRELLAEAEPMERWGVVVRRYLKAGLTEEIALTTARVARVLREGEYVSPGGSPGDDFTYVTGVKLWTPQ